MEHQKELVHDPLNDAIFNELEYLLTQILRSHHYLTLNVSEMVRDTYIVTTEYY